MFDRLNSRYLAGLLLIGLAIGCGPPETFDRQGMVEETVDTVIMPAHDKLSKRADALHSSVTKLCEGDQKKAQLEDARSAWRDLQEPLKWIQAWSFNMSPYRGKSFGVFAYKIDREPSWGDNIEAVIDGDETYRRDLNRDGDEKPDEPFGSGADKTIDEDFVASQNYLRNAKGYPAVEYLLFSDESFQGGMSNERRCDYLSAVSKHAKGVVAEYVKAWSRDGGDFAGRFDSPSSDDMDWATTQDSINAMVSQMVFVSKQRISKSLLGGPLGQHEDDNHVPDSVSSPHANASLAQMKATLAGLEKLYSGGGGRSLADYTKFRKKSVHKLVDTRIEKARKAIEAIPEPLEDAVENKRQKVISAQEAVDSLAAAIEADLKTSLGATTTRVVVDND